MSQINLKETFAEAIGKAMEATSTIADVSKQASVYAQIAHAIALTGAIAPGAAVDVEEQPAAKTKAAEKKAEKKVDTTAPSAEERAKIVASTAKAALTHQPAKKAAPAKATAPTPTPEPKETPAAAPAAKAETAEWSEEAMKNHSAELDYISKIAGQYGNDAVNTALQNYSEGTLKDFTTDVNPLNVKTFVEYMKEQLAALEGASNS